MTHLSISQQEAGFQRKFPDSVLDHPLRPDSEFRIINASTKTSFKWVGLITIIAKIIAPLLIASIAGSSASWGHYVAAELGILALAVLCIAGICLYRWKKVRDERQATKEGARPEEIQQSPTSEEIQSSSETLDNNLDNNNEFTEFTFEKVRSDSVENSAGESESLDEQSSNQPPSLRSGVKTGEARKKKDAEREQRMGLQQKRSQSSSGFGNGIRTGRARTRGGTNARTRREKSRRSLKQSPYDTTSLNPPRRRRSDLHDMSGGSSGLLHKII